MPVADVLVDTNLLWKRSLRDQLAQKISQGVLRAYVPTLIHAERIRQIADEKGDDFAIHIIQQLVEASGFQLLPFTVADAEAVAQIWLTLKGQGATYEYWREHRFDILLCAIAQARGYTLITDDGGSHFEVVTSRMNTKDLLTWLAQL